MTSSAGIQCTLLHTVAGDYQDEHEFVTRFNFGQPFRVRIDGKNKKISVWKRDFIWKTMRRKPRVIQLGVACHGDGRDEKVETRSDEFGAENKNDDYDEPKQIKLVSDEPEASDDTADDEQSAKVIAERRDEYLLTRQESEYGWATEKAFRTWCYTDVWIGTDLDHPELNGNTILFQTDEARMNSTEPEETSHTCPFFVWIANERVERIFLAVGDKPCTLLSPIGNNDAPYPMLIGAVNTYLLLDSVYISNKHVPTSWLFPRHDKFDLYEKYWESKSTEPTEWTRMRPAACVQYD